MKAWYFAPQDERLAHGDGRPIILGETHYVAKDKLKLYYYGLHASKSILNSLNLAKSTILYEVELSGDIKEEGYTVVAEYRKYLRRVDISSVLKEFARKQACINIALIEPYCSAANYALIVNWLERGDKNLISEVVTVINKIRKWETTAAWATAEAVKAAAEERAFTAAVCAARAIEAIKETPRWAATREEVWAARTEAWNTAETMLWEMVMGEFRKTPREVIFKEKIKYWI